LIWWMIKAEHKRLIFLADFSELKVYGINLAFSFIRSIIACVQACYVCCTGRVRYAFGQFYSVKGKISWVKKRADPVPEAPTRVGSGEGNNQSKVLPPQKFCRETASNPGPGDSAS
jgi:hypothetical protein